MNPPAATHEASLERSRRRVILHVLGQALGNRASDSILQCSLDRIGLPASRDLLHTTLAWLAEQGLVQLEQIDSLVIATATRRGLDVAEARAHVPGVADRYD